MNLWFQTALLPGGWRSRVRIEIRDGLVAAITPEADPAATDDVHAIGLPGLANVHSHAFQRAMAGLAEGTGLDESSFWTWRDVMYRFVDLIDPDDAEAIAELAYAEMLESGFTRVGEFHYLHNARDGHPYAAPSEMATRIVAAARETGIGLTLLPVFYAHGGFGLPIRTSGQRRFVTSLDGFARLVADCRCLLTGADDVLGIAPHSLRAATIDEIQTILPLSAGGPVHIHIAEQTQEVVDCIAATGRRPVELLFENIDVSERWCLVHATHVTETELSRIAGSGAVAGLCPVTEANLGDGVFPTPSFIRQRGRISVGTDSNILISPGGELRAVEYAQRLSAQRRNVLGIPGKASSGRVLFDACIQGGGQAMAASCGLAIGRSADIVSLRADEPTLASRKGDQILDAWIFAAPSPLIDCVWRRGSKVVDGGRHICRDAIVRRYAAAIKRILQ